MTDIIRAVDDLPALHELPWPVETLTNLLQQPNPRWIIEDIIPENAFVLIYGPHGCGKSFFALDSAIHLGLRYQKWLGKDIDQPSRPLYIAAEGGGGVVKRAKAWFQGRGVDYPVDSPVQFIRKPVNLLDPETYDKLILTWAAAANPAPLYIDTWSRCMAGANENSAEHTSAAVEVLDAYRATTKSSVLAVHHTPNEAKDRPRGSNALIAACDVAIMVENRNGTRVATVTRSRDGEDGIQFTFTLDPVDLGPDDKGRPVSSCIVTPSNKPAPKRTSAAREPSSKHQAPVWKAFKRALDEKSLPSPGFTGMPEGRVVLEETVRSIAYPMMTCETKRRAQFFNDALASLIAKDFIGKHNEYLWRADQ